MPKNEIDYSNTIIYKITCKNKEITDVYVGHTTNFVQRKHAHKQSCINNTSLNHKCKLYEVIRANGGWENWQMEIINFFNCADHYAARKKEQEYFIELNATLNSIEPFPKPKVVIEKKIVNVKQNLYCNTCNIKCNNSKSFDIHNKSNKHIKIINEQNIQNIQNPKNFHCKNCNLVTSNKKDYSKHLLTAKHIKTAEGYNKIQKSQDLRCECGKIYKHYSGLWRHKKVCKNEVNEVCKNEVCKNEVCKNEDNEIITIIKDNNDFKNIIIEVVKNNAELQKQNQEFQKQMMELYKTNNSVIANNSYNKTFNMQFFLNEQCKDAMNLMDFVNSMTLELSDLEDVGKLGYVEGISNIIIKNLNALDIYKRPIHCSDAKREIMYVKYDNVWEKETSNNDRLRKAIKRVTYKNSALLVPWSQKYPACMNNQHHLNDVYVQMMGQAMGGKEEFVDSENKIMKKIAKAVLIEKNF
jgi:hypothetical protein